jgi:hypothetical protein
VQAGNSQDPFPFRHGQNPISVRSSEVQAMKPVMRAKKYPDEKFEYGIIWQDFEDGEVIAISTWTVLPTTDITKISSDHTDDRTWFWVEGGRFGVKYVFKNTITTNQARIYVRWIVIEVSGVQL